LRSFAHLRGCAQDDNVWRNGCVKDDNVEENGCVQGDRIERSGRDQDDTPLREELRPGARFSLWLRFRLVPSLARRSVHLNELLKGFAIGVDVDAQNHAAGDFVKTVEVFGGVGATFEIEDGLEMGDDDERVIQLRDACFDIAAIYSIEGAAKIAKDGVVERKDEAYGRCTVRGVLLIGGDDAGI